MKALPCSADNIGNADFEKTKLEYDLDLMQGLWEYQGQDGRQKTKQIRGNTVTTTDYAENGAVWQQSRQDLTLVQSGPVSLCTYRNFETTAGPAKGQKTPPGWSHAHLYTVNRDEFVEILEALDGTGGPVALRQWKRIGSEK